MKKVKALVKGTFLEPWARKIHARLRRALYREESAQGGQRKDAASNEALLTEDVKRYDIQTVEVMKRVLRTDSVCIDVGAHKGDVLEDMVALAPKGRHHAFEPIPSLARRLRERFPNVVVHEAALSDEEGEAEFQHVVNSPGYSGLRKRDYDRLDPVIEVLRVRKVRLDDLLPKEEEVSFIKIDVEGGEYHALRGAAEILKRNKPVVVFEAGAKSTSHYGVGPADLYRLLAQDCGLRISTMERWLDGSAPLDKEAFLRHYQEGLDYYFLAYPVA